MSKFIGTAIGAVFVLLILGAPLFGSFYFGKNLYYAFVDSTYKEATITGCHTIRSKGGGNVRYSHAPIAKTADGEVVKGKVGPKKSEKCKKNIGKKVGVFISNISPDKSQINTFGQLYFYPIIFFSMTILLYGAMARKLISRKN